MIKIVKSKTKNMVKHKDSKKDKLEISKAEDEYEEPSKVVVSSMNELMHVENKKTEKNIEEHHEVKQEVKEIVEDKPGVYFYPPITLLSKPSKTNTKDNETAIKANVPIAIIEPYNVSAFFAIFFILNNITTKPIIIIILTIAPNSSTIIGNIKSVNASGK